MKKVVLALLLVPLTTTCYAGDDFSLNFGPAPVNLANQENGLSLGYDVVNVDVKDAGAMTATTTSIAYRSKMSGSKMMKSFFYATNISSDFYDTGAGIGFGSNITWGSPTGLAGLLGLHMDVQNFDTTLSNGNELYIEIATYAFDIGAQYHKQISEDATLVPWFKFSSIKGYSDVGGSCNTSPCFLSDQDPIDIALTATTLGFDIKYKSFSLGAMYQSHQSADIKTLSLSYDF